MTQLGIDNSSTKLYPLNTVFVTARGTVGAVSIAGREMTMNQSCYALSGINPYFIHQTTLSVIQNLKNAATGAVFSALVTRDFNEQFLSYPANNPELEDQFQKKVSTIYSMILIKTNEINILEELKDLLLSKLATIKY